MGSITVHGTGSVACDPDRVELVLALTARENHPDAALEKVAAREGVLRAVLDDLGISADARTTTGAMVREEPDHERDAERHAPTSCRADSITLVRLDDISLVGRVMREATARAGAQVRGPTWRVADDHPARLEACKAAAQDAIARATAYAEAVGKELGEVLTLTEAVRFASFGSRLVSAGGEATDESGVSPGKLQATANVEAKFELKDP